MVLKERLRNLDAHSSVPTEFRVYTTSGAVLSVVTVVVILYLVVTEAYFNFQVTLEEKVYVNATSPDGLELEFDITLQHVPCANLNIDANDPTGQSQSLHLDRAHHVWKHRMKFENGKSTLIGQKSKLELGSTLLTEEDLIAEYKGIGMVGEEEEPSEDTEAKETPCGSCYGAGEQGECCDTCDDVHRAYKRKGWAISSNDEIEQCKGKKDNQDGEGCNIHGVVALSTGGGNLHIAPGKNNEDTENTSPRVFASLMDLLSETMQQWNVSHTINKLRFGPYYPAATYQLDGQTRKIKDEYGMYQYYFKVGCDYCEKVMARHCTSPDLCITHTALGFLVCTYCT